MPRPVTLFTGQWADLSLEELAPKIRDMGYDGVELACWGDHFEIEKINDKGYIKQKWELLADNDLDCLALSHHLVGQAVCDPIDSRHKGLLPAEIWGDGDPEGVRCRAAENMQAAAKACRKFFNSRPKGLGPLAGDPVVNGFTGSSIWHLLYSFPPVPPAYIEAGYQDFANRWLPILEVFDAEKVNFALEVHPTEIAFDIASSHRALAAIDHHPRFGFNFDPSHLGYQGVDYVRFIREFSKRIYNVHMKDAWWGHGDGTVGVFGGHTEFGDARRYWDFRSVGRGDIAFEDIIVALNDIDYRGPLSVEWEDGRMERFHGATEAAEFVRALDFPPSNRAFDSAFEREDS